MWYLCVLVGLLALAGISSPWCEAFNIETKHFTAYRQVDRSMFGFAVSEYRDRNSRGWVIVGAPEAQTSQRGVFRGGAVYRCDIAADDRCAIIEFDNRGNNYNNNPHAQQSGLTQMDNKTLQWFGATVSASVDDGGPILACAPRYVWFSSTLARREPVGTCYVTNFTVSQEFSPCRTRHWGYHRQGSCQAGLGATVSKHGDRLFIGAPGSWYWQGQAFSQSISDRTRVMFTKEGPAEEDDSYMGYSVATGDFVGNGDSGIAVGMPRGAGLRGKVVLFTSNMTNHQNITGEQMGAYFGYAVASCDVDGDGLDDLIIGAPMYTTPENPEMTFETGRIYVVYQGSGPDKFRKVDSRDGESNRGRFGLSLASLDDIDRDGYGDFAVGAPYGGLDGRGAVYVYHGSREGVLEKYSQVIYAEDLQVPVETFGFSIAGGLDLDGNRYPDVVVGSYESDTAMFFRSRPVIKMDSYVEFESDSKLIALDTKNCRLSDGNTVTCLPLSACFTYSGEGVLSAHDFDIQFVLDVKKTKSPRLFFLDHEGKNTMNHTITLNRDEKFCRRVKVYVAPNIRDKLTSLDAEMRMSLTEERIPDDRPREPRSSLRPVLGTTTSRKDTLSIRKNCGPDNVCIPDLQLIVKPNVDRYLLGSARRLEFDVLVQNEGEDAFEAMYNLKLPSGIDYIKIERVDKTEIPVQCSAPKQSNNNTLRCDIGNPLPQRKFVHFIVLLQPVTSHGMKPTYEFDMEVNTTNPENDTMNDNRQHISLPIWIETELLVEGESKPKDLYYNPDNYTSEEAITTELEFGPAVIHNYTIRNQGPSDILEAEALLVWPAQTLAGDELVYLLEQPETSGPIACAPANANYLSLKLDQRRRAYLNYIDSSGVILEESPFSSSINVQSGYGEISEAERKKMQEEENEITEGSGIQRTRQKSGVVSSETRRVQLTSTGSKPGVLTTTYTQNSSGTGSGGNSAEDSRHQSHVVYHSTSSSGGGYEGGSSTFGRVSPTTIHETSFESSGSRHAVPSWQDQEKILQSNRTGSFRHTWDDDTNVGDTIDEDIRFKDTDRIRPEVNVAASENERRYSEVRRVQEEQQRRREEEERVRQQERLDAGFDRESYGSREHVYGTERHYSTDAEGSQGHRSGVSGITSQTRIQDGIIGDREETVGGQDINVRLHNINSTQDLEKFFGSLSQDAAAYNVYSRQGRQYVLFEGRFQTATDGKEYLEFKDGTKLPLENNYGEPSFASGDSGTFRQNQFLRLEGQLVTDQDAKQYIQLKDGRRFPLHGSYTYTEERTYTLGGGSREVDAAGTYGTGIKTSHHGGKKAGDENFRSYGKSYHEESSNRDSDQDKEFETYSTRTHEEKHSSDRKVNSRVYERDSGVDVPIGDNVPTNRPDQRRNLRYRRESDVVSVNDFKRFEKHHRHQRDLAGSQKEDARLDVLSSSRRSAEDGFRNDDNRDYDGVAKLKQQDLPCTSAKCVTLRCTLGPLEKDQEVWIGVRYRVNARTLKKIAFNEQVKVSTQLIAQVTKQPFIGTPIGQVVKSHEIFTNVQPSAPPAAPDVVPLWVVVLSACAGTLILLLLIYLLHKCGFFKRNRPTDAPERQPLNRNGHFQHGDEHL